MVLVDSMSSSVAWGASVWRMLVQSQQGPFNPLTIKTVPILIHLASISSSPNTGHEDTSVYLQASNMDSVDKGSHVTIIIMWSTVSFHLN